VYRIQNNEKELAYVETVKLFQMDKVYLLSPEIGKSYQIKVNPGQTRDIVYRFGINGHNI